MGQERVYLTPGAAQKTADVVRQAQRTPIDMRGKPKRRRGPLDYGHGAKGMVLMTLDQFGNVGWDYPRMN